MNEQIELTEDFLVLNGFTKSVDENGYDQYKWERVAGDGYVRITLIDDGDGEWTLLVKNYDKFLDRNTDFKREHSHIGLQQLQNIFKLCGVTKEFVFEEKAKIFVGENLSRDKDKYPFCYGYEKYNTSIFGVTKTKEEAEEQLNKIIKQQARSNN